MEPKQTEHLHSIIHDLAAATGTLTFSWPVVFRFVLDEAQRRVHEIPHLRRLLGERAEAHLVSYLEELEAESIVELHREGDHKRGRNSEITEVRYRLFFPCEIDRWYRDMERGKRNRFPGHDTLAIPPPQNLVRSVDITAGLSGVLGEDYITGEMILSVRFPEPAPTLLATPRNLLENVPDLAFLILRSDILREWSVARLLRGLGSVLPGSRQEIKAVVKLFLSDTTGADRFFRDTTDSQQEILRLLGRAILQAKQKKSIPEAQDATTCQAAYLLDDLTTRHREQTRQERARRKIKRTVARHLRGKPRCFSVPEVASLAGNVSPEVLQSALQEMIQDEKNGQSELIYLEIPARGGHYIHTVHYGTVLEREIVEARPAVQAAVVDEMIRLMRKNLRKPLMTDESALEEYLNPFMVAERPLLYGLVRNRTGSSLADKPWTTILEIDGAALLEEARRRLPFLSQLRTELP